VFLGTQTGEKEMKATQQVVITLEITAKEADAIVKARRDLRKDTLRQDLGDYETDVVNGLSMIIGSLIEDQRESRKEDFDSRSY